MVQQHQTSFDFQTALTEQVMLCCSAMGAALGDQCSFSCAFIYLASADRCTAARQTRAFEPTFTASCEAAVTAALAAAPDSLVVSGLACRGLQNAEFFKDGSAKTALMNHLLYCFWPFFGSNLGLFGGRGRYNAA